MMHDIVLSLVIAVVAIAAILTVIVLAIGSALFFLWLADRLMERWWRAQ